MRRVAYTLQEGRVEMPERVAFIARSIDEWAEQLDAFVRNDGKVNDRNVYRGTVSGANVLDVGDTQAGKDYIARLMHSDERGTIAALWVKGTKIDWREMHN